MHEEPDLIACECCDALFHRAVLADGEAARCTRCGMTLERQSGRVERNLLPLSIACLILLLIANALPVVSIELQGYQSQTTLFGAVTALTLGGEPVVAVLVLATTILFPILYVSVLILLSLPLSSPWLRRRMSWLIRALRAARPWGMVEIFMLGILVAIVKLVSMATVEPGVSLWALIGATILLTTILGFDLRTIWLTDVPAAAAHPDSRPGGPDVDAAPRTAHERA